MSFHGKPVVNGPSVPKRNKEVRRDEILFRSCEFLVASDGDLWVVQKDNSYDYRLEFTRKCDLGSYLLGISLTGRNFLQYARQTRDAVFKGDYWPVPHLRIGMARLSRDDVTFESRHIASPGTEENGTIDIRFQELYDWTVKNLNVSCSLFYQNNRLSIYKASVDGGRVQYYLVDKTPNPALCAPSLVDLVREYKTCRLDWYSDATNFLIARYQDMASNFRYVRRDHWTSGVKDRNAFKTLRNGNLQCSFQPFTVYPDDDNVAKAFVNYIYEIPVSQHDINLFETPIYACNYTVAHYLPSTETTLSSDDQPKIGSWNRITGDGLAHCGRTIKSTAMKTHEIYQLVYESLLDFLGYEPYYPLP